MSYFSKHNAIQWIDYYPRDLLVNSDIHIFKIDCSLYTFIEDNLATVLTEAEVKKMNLFFKKADAVRFALGKYFLRKILGEQLKTPPKTLDILISKSKKPYLSAINFNISHSGDYVVIAISKSVVGIDIELMKNFDFNPVAEACFTPNERRHIIDIRSFYAFWTRKEAVLKATGEGLIDNLHEIECDQQSVRRLGINLQLKSYTLGENYLLSLAYSEHDQNVRFWNLGRG